MSSMMGSAAGARRLPALGHQYSSPILVKLRYLVFIHGVMIGWYRFYLLLFLNFRSIFCETAFLARIVKW